MSSRELPPGRSSATRDALSSQGSNKGGRQTQLSGGRRADLTTLAKGSLLTLVGSIGSSVFGFLLVVVITRGLHAGRAGVLFEAIALFMILSNTLELGADTALVRMVARYRALGRIQDIRSTLVIALVPVLALGALVGGVMFLLAPQIASLFADPRHAPEALTYIRLLALFLPLASATTVSLAATRGLGTMAPYVAIQNLGIPGARPVVMLLVIAAGLGTVVIGLAWALPVAIGFAFAMSALIILHRRMVLTVDRPGPARPTAELAGDFWRFAAPRGMATMLQASTFWVDILLLGALRSSSEAGVYAAASRFVGVGTFALQAVGLAIAPQISGLLARDDRSSAQTIFETATWWLMAMSWPLYLSIAIFAPFFMSIFGRDFVQGQHALLILSLGLLVLIATGNNKVVLLMAGGSGANLAITALSLTTNVTLNLILIPRLGMVGAALASMSTTFLDNVATTTVVRFRLHLHPFRRGWGLVAITALLCYGTVGVLVRLVLGANLASLIVHGIVATSAYVALLWRLRGLLHLNVVREVLRSRRLPQQDVSVESPELGGEG